MSDTGHESPEALHPSARWALWLAALALLCSWGLLFMAGPPGPALVLPGLAGPGPSGPRLVISVEAGQLWFEGQRVSPEELGRRLRARREARPWARVWLRAGAETPLEQLREVVLVLEGAGVDKIVAAGGAS